MEEDLKIKLEKLKQEAIDNPGTPVKKKCTSCKKKKEITEPLVLTIEDLSTLPTSENIKLAYAELTSFGGVKEDKKEFIQNIYEQLFNESFDFNCRSCVSAQARKFSFWMKQNGLI